MMRMEIWNKFSYIIQLILACLVFLSVVRKKSYFIIRVLGGILLLLFGSYIVNTFFSEQDNFIQIIAYWMFFLVECIIFSIMILDGTLLEAVYCAICGCAIQHVAFDIYLSYEILGGKNYLTAILIYVIVYILFYYFFAKKMPDRGHFAVSKGAILPSMTIILIVWILSCLETIHATNASVLYRIVYRVLDMLCVCYVLWVQINQKERMSLQRELDGINNAWRQKSEQYEITQETIDVINRKCHDLKHQIRALRLITDEKEKEEYFDEIEKAVMIYDTALRTGNRALDTVLMEKGLYCQSHGIQLTCMADGLKLDFMKIEDVYAIFGNALDNSICAVMNIDDPSKRIISLKMLTQQSLLMIQIQNYYYKELKFEGGLPITTKNKKEHGFGMKSIRHTAEKYNGTITVQAKNNIFTLQILIPMI